MNQHVSRARDHGSNAVSAFRFVLLLGVVNLFADMTYEGGASINGPFLGSLGASAAAISIVAGVGEFLGYCLRSVSGYVSDKTGKHWAVTFVGYTLNLFAVPAMALAGSWQLGAALILVERIGRAIRKPTIEAMLSYSTHKLGRGWVYGLNTALDETGAALGPFLIGGILFLKGDFRTGYGALLASVAFAIAALVAARIVFPVPANLEDSKQHQQPRKFGSAYWLNMIAGACFAVGLTSFEIVSYHFARTGLVKDHWIPISLGVSTALGAFASLVLGRTYDRLGVKTVVAAVFLSALSAPLIFLGNTTLALIGLALWGIGYATQDTLLKAIIAGLLPEGRRSFAFGLFYIAYGAGWLIGSLATGILYERSLIWLAGIACASQVISIPFFLIAERSSRRNPT